MRAPLNVLPVATAEELDVRGFTVLHDVLPGETVARLAIAYESAVASAAVADVRVGSTTTRLADFVNRGEAFDALYVLPPVLEACRRVIGPAFKLSSFHARTLRPRTPAQGLHVDVRRGSKDWPLLGFIVMIDAFTEHNGATRFVPGSHRWPRIVDEADAAVGAEREREVQACGAAGSLIVFNGSVWHEHAANTTDRPRRSLQGAFIPRDGRAGTDFGSRMDAGTLARLSAPARDVLAIDTGRGVERPT